MFPHATPSITVHPKLELGSILTLKCSHTSETHLDWIPCIDDYRRADSISELHLDTENNTHTSAGLQRVESHCDARNSRWFAFVKLPAEVGAESLGRRGRLLIGAFVFLCNSLSRLHGSSATEAVKWLLWRSVSKRSSLLSWDEERRGAKCWGRKRAHR